MGLGFAQIASIKGSRSFVCFPSCVVQLVHGVWPREFAGVNKLTLNAPLFPSLFPVSLFFLFVQSSARQPFLRFCWFFRTREQAILPRSRDTTCPRVETIKESNGLLLLASPIFCSRAFLFRSNYEWILFIFYSLLHGRRVKIEVILWLRGNWGDTYVVIDSMNGMCRLIDLEEENS